LSKTEVSKELTPERFATFLAFLSADIDEAANEYERLRFRLTTFFAHRNCLFAEDLTDETINRVALKIGEEHIENKLAYFFGVARNVFLESLRKERRHENVDELSIAAAPPADEEDRKGQFLDKCLSELPEDNRRLILDYMSQEKQAKIDLHKRLAESLNMTQTALRMKVVRIKQKLKLCLQECMA
jgi:RNA polymerase sigma factor (sigma-70 family)